MAEAGEMVEVMRLIWELVQGVAGLEGHSWKGMCRDLETKGAYWFQKHLNMARDNEDNQ